MNTPDTISYNRIADAIEYLKKNFQSQPGLDELAKQVHLSPFHFQRLFTEWAGISPKKFLQFLTVEYAKGILKEKQASLFDTAFETGLSGTGRLHDLFIKIEGMTPGEFKNGGEQLSINYSFAESPFGDIIVASTPKGICHLAFADDKKKALEELKRRFPKASWQQVVDMIQQSALHIFKQDWNKPEQVKLHIKGTAFQLKVWQALLEIPSGDLSTYSRLAEKIHQPGAARAVGTAVGDNPAAFLIPCHRVIKSTGLIGDYHWGSTRKTAIIGWEAAKNTAPEAS
ncbi:MAG TPA: methylated-DNA--[protein]-cysteine S-methyltransferase [Chitinophagaceae bacterium]|jgi:AraC family transcriptional regulator of adaptative response/methylated-DNA-[protein]-cysteine methyltransferase